MFNTLSYIGDKLNDSNILWGVGASILLNKFKLIDKPNDIDIFVDMKDINKADIILKSLGEKKQSEKTATFSTKHFYEYVINGFEIDVMAGFGINHSSGAFEYIFDQNSVSEYVRLNGVDVPFTSLEDWYVLYQLIPNREVKVKLIENYLLTNGVEKPELLLRALKKDLPIEVRDRIKNVLGV